MSLLTRAKQFINKCKSVVPYPLINLINKQIRLPLRQCSYNYRMDPDFFIIGTMRGGTTSLYHYLFQHPQLLTPFDGKEIHYFDKNFDQPLEWFQAHFPLNAWDRLTTKKLLTGEGSPDYLYYPQVPERLHDLHPNSKFIVLLRDPVSRAFSHFQRINRLERGQFNSFREAVEYERTLEDFLDKKEQQLKQGEIMESWFYRYHSFLRRGCYNSQLQRWFKLFDREQFYVESSERFFQSPGAVIEEIFKFLGLDATDTGHYNFKPRNVGQYQSNITSGLQSELEEYFKSPNNKLNNLLDKKFKWM